ncbi:variable surface lipoprotein [Mycoplasma sp. 3398]
MNKITKTLISIGSISALTLPLIAISCTNYKAELEREVSLAKQQLSNIEFADDYEDKLRKEIIDAENILKNNSSKNIDYQKALSDFIENTNKILNDNKTTTEKYSNNQRDVFIFLNTLKQYAHEQLSDKKYNELKIELVKQYSAKEEEIKKINSVLFNDNAKAKLIQELNKILDDIKTKKAEVDKKASAKLF